MINVLKEIEIEFKKLDFRKIEYANQTYEFKKRISEYNFCINIDKNRNCFYFHIQNFISHDFIFSKYYYINKITDIDCIHLINRIKMFFSLFNDLVV